MALVLFSLHTSALPQTVVTRVVDELVALVDDDASGLAEDTSEAEIPSSESSDEELDAILVASVPLSADRVSVGDRFHLHAAPRDGHPPQLDRPPRA